MAQTVGYPCAIAAHLVLEGQITQPGKLEGSELLFQTVRGLDRYEEYFRYGNSAGEGNLQTNFI